jgi:hypothetical protein
MVGVDQIRAEVQNPQTVVVEHHLAGHYLVGNHQRNFQVAVDGSYQHQDVLVALVEILVG